MYKYILIAVLFIAGCTKDNEPSPVTSQKQFDQMINTTDTSKQYSVNDTIWFNINTDTVIKDINTGEEVELRNATYILSGVINLIEPQYDSLIFIDRNFDIIEEDGNVVFINVFNSTQSSYSFDIKYGKPLNTNNVKFGLILDYPGIFGIEFNGYVYYGDDRTDYDDYSLENKGYINFIFGMNSINESIYHTISIESRYKYDNYYNTNKMAHKRVFFIDVKENN